VYIPGVGNGASADTPNNSGDELASEIEQAGWRKETPAPSLSDELQDLSQSQEPLSLADSDLMCGLLEVMVVLWEVAKDRLDKPTNQKIRKKLWNKMTKSLPLFFDIFTVSVVGPPPSIPPSIPPLSP
jgi:hypothetical protein